MNPLDKVKKQITELINQALDGKADIKESDLVFPPTPKAMEGKSPTEYGDLSLPCFGLAKELKKTPNEVALWLKSALITELNSVSSIAAAGPYLNFILNKIYLAEELIKEAEKKKEEFGKNEEGGGKRVMIEYSNVNTHKEYHVGHLRNICYGDAVNKILGASGYKIIPVSYINDFGIHVAKALWAYKKFYRGHKLPTNKGHFLGKIYTRAAQEMEKNLEAKDEVIALMKKIESETGSDYKLWQKTRLWSIKQFDGIYKILGIKFEKTFYESEFIKRGRKMVAELYKKKFLIKSHQAVIADLEKHNLGVLMFLRSDGTALYPVADLPLALEKFKKYKPDKSIYVVDLRQSLYFKQLAKVLELLGEKKEIVHLGYDVVRLPSGMMSSRRGTVIAFETLWEEARKKAVSETWKRHEDWPRRKIEQVAKRLVVGAIKFEMVKVGREKAITFDIVKALKFEGFTAAYLQYAFARINSIIKKAKIKKVETQNFASPQLAKLTETKEQELIMKLAKYPEVVKKAAADYEPSEIAKYLFELAQEFNDYYHQVPVIKAEPETRAARLALIGAVSQVLANGLGLLGIETMEEM